MKRYHVFILEKQQRDTEMKDRITNRRIIKSIVCISMLTIFLAGCNKKGTGTDTAQTEVSTLATETQQMSTSEEGKTTSTSDDTKKTEKKSWPFVKHFSKQFTTPGEAKYSIDITFDKEALDSDSKMLIYQDEKMIYEYNYYNTRIIEVNMDLVDLDNDGQNELLFTIYPMVNSADLTEYLVLKQTGTEWKEMDRSDTRGDFDITIENPEDCKVILGCEGTSKVIELDLKEYYKELLKDVEGDEYNSKIFKDIIENGLNSQGYEVGYVGGFGVCCIEVSSYDGIPCMIAKYGIEGTQKSDYWGTLAILFHYNSAGDREILNLEFYDNSEV